MTNQGLLLKAQDVACHLAKCFDAYAAINYRLMGTKCSDIEYTEMDSLSSALDLCLQRVLLLEKYLCSTIKDINNNPEIGSDTKKGE